MKNSYEPFKAVREAKTDTVKIVLTPSNWLYLFIDAFLVYNVWKHAHWSIAASITMLMVTSIMQGIINKAYGKLIGELAKIVKGLVK